MATNRNYIRTLDYIGTLEAAKVSRVAVRTVIKWFEDGEVTGYLVPGSKHRRISVSSLRAFLAKNDVPVDLIDAAYPTK